MEENRRAKERNRKEMEKQGREMSGYGVESEGKSKRCAEMRRRRTEKDRRGVEQKWRRELQREAGEKISRAGISRGQAPTRRCIDRMSVGRAKTGAERAKSCKGMRWARNCNE